MKINPDNLQQKLEFSRKFGHFFRTPLSYLDSRNGKSEPRTEMVRAIFAKILNLGQEFISFAYYWGAGIKSAPGRPEQEFISYLNDFTLQFSEFFGKQSHRELAILTDTHATINCIPEDSWQIYFEKVTQRYRDSNRQFIFTSELWNKAGKDIKREKRIADGMHGPYMIEKDIIERWARKHFYGPPEETRLAAKRYYRYNMIEKELIETYYPDYFFISWNSSKLDPVMPSSLPILHLHVDSRETDADKPWFVSDDAD